jgi:hypothetical protein
METPRTPRSLSKNKGRVHTTQLSLSLSLSSMAQLDQNLCGRKNKKERKKEWERKEREDR